LTAIIVCCHAELSQGFAGAVEMIAGEQEQFFTLGLQPGESLANLIARIAGCIGQSGADRAVVLTDLFGASPANAAAAALFSAGVETVVITGANLAAILEAAVTRNDSEPLDTFATRICEVGRDNMRVVNKRLLHNAGGATL
jgi:mannose/fructose-specific phosphotransferase system component IIA